MRNKRDYEFVIFAAIIVVSIAASLTYSGFIDGDLPTGMPVNDAGIVTFLCGGTSPPLPDGDGDGLPDGCDPYPGSSDGDGDGIGDYEEAVAAISFILTTDGTNGPVYGTVASTSQVSEGTYDVTFNFLDTVANNFGIASGSYTLTATGGSITSQNLAAPGGPAGQNLVVRFKCDQTTENGRVRIGLGETLPPNGGTRDSRNYLVLNGDADPTQVYEDITQSFNCPVSEVIGTGGSTNCRSTKISPETVKFRGNQVEFLVEIEHQELYRNRNDPGALDQMVWARAPYPGDEIRVIDAEFENFVELVPGISQQNLPGVFKITIDADPDGDGDKYEGPIDLIIGFGLDKANTCFERFFVEWIPGVAEVPPVPCTEKMIKENIAVDTSDAAVQGRQFSFRAAASFDAGALPCDYQGTGKAELVSATVLADDVYLMGPAGKGEKGGTVPIGDEGIVRGGGISGYLPERDAAEPGAPSPPRPPDRAEEEVEIPFEITVSVDGVNYKVPITVSLPLPTYEPEEPEPIPIDIPDNELLNIFDIPYGDLPPGFIPEPEPIPYPTPLPDPSPPEPLPDPIARIFHPSPPGEYLKHYQDTVELGEVSTDEGRKLDESRTIQITEGVANGRVFVGGSYGSKRETVRVFLERGGELVDRIRTLIPRTEAVADLRDLTEKVIPAGEYTTGDWKGHIALDTKLDGGAFYQMDYNDLEDGKYSLIALNGDQVKTFYFEKKMRQIIFLEVPLGKLTANLRLVAREVGIPATITRLGKESITLYYKEGEWKTEAGEQTETPKDLT